MKGEDFDYLFSRYYEKQVYYQTAESRHDVPILGADGFDSPELVNLAGKEALNTVYFSNHYSLDQDPVVQNFIKTFEKI